MLNINGQYILQMADGPIANLPSIFQGQRVDAYAGYTDISGIGITYPYLPPATYHLSISVHGKAPAYCGDVEAGALGSWAGYTVGYCDLSHAQEYINSFGRPRKLWIAHRDPKFGMHICTPACGFGFNDYADGTQCFSNGQFDMSWLKDNFFDFLTMPGYAPYLPNGGVQPVQPVDLITEESMQMLQKPDGTIVICGAARDNGNLLIFEGAPGQKWTVGDITDGLGTDAAGRRYAIEP